MTASLYEGEDRRQNKQRRHRRGSQTADDRASERRGLLPALSETDGHRQHPCDHRQACHQNRTQAALRTLDG